MKLNLTRVAAAALLAGAAIAAHADVTLSLPGWQFGGNSVNVTSPVPYGGQAGAFAGSLSNAGIFNSASFVTYCVELEQSFGFSSNLTGYNIVSPASYTGVHPNGWGSGAVGIGDRLGQLLTYSLPLVTDSAKSTALQLAIWNTIYDTDNTVSSGTFIDSSGFAGQANAYLANSLSTVSALQVAILNNPTAQDFVAYAPIPEPGTYAMMLAGLAGMGFVARRRARQA